MVHGVKKVNLSLLKSDYQVNLSLYNLSNKKLRGCPKNFRQPLFVCQNRNLPDINLYTI